ncbi:hypothetical protein FG386_000219 [Cryptosporidium ryanae]|uniref:uncharacterized protein n=1 Tax=Cryptosporidium ryanae TaxID=515981 RepID=UPI003519F177|nr:hypothetical protein FG386_000219 [Cryptosporidium ryanae]
MLKKNIQFLQFEQKKVVFCELVHLIFLLLEYIKENITFIMLNIHFGDSDNYSSYIILDESNEQKFRNSNKNSFNNELNSTISTINGEHENSFKQLDLHFGSKKETGELLEFDTVSLFKGENYNYLSDNKQNYAIKCDLNRQFNSKNNKNERKCKKNKSHHSRYFLDNYLKFIWEVGDEFSELHCISFI